ncbi:MAG: class I SAM-dependent methyltransferase [Thermoproteus sp.]|nr:class I SAM-dependent methyltransferase [Thermoproteus sp.]
MDWALAAREAYRAIAEAYEASRRRPLPTADIANFGDKALDLGSGRGAQPPYLEASYRYIVHCDLAPELVPRGSEAVLCEATALPFRDGAFDVVHAVAVYHHLPPGVLGAAFAEALRVGGAVVATVWSLPGGGGAVRRVPWRWRGEALRVYYVYSLRDLASAALAAGGRLVALGYMRRGRRLNAFAVVLRRKN